jgi:hypothetical protein
MSLRQVGELTAAVDGDGRLTPTPAQLQAAILGPRSLLVCEQ